MEKRLRALGLLDSNPLCTSLPPILHKEVQFLSKIILHLAVADFKLAAEDCDDEALARFGPAPEPKVEPVAPALPVPPPAVVPKKPLSEAQMDARKINARFGGPPPRAKLIAAARRFYRKKPAVVKKLESAQGNLLTVAMRISKTPEKALAWLMKGRPELDGASLLFLRRDPEMRQKAFAAAINKLDRGRL